jgi:excisionase family DNA binding protein
VNIGQPGTNKGQGRQRTPNHSGGSRSEFVTRFTMSANGLVLKIVGDILIIETADPDELRSSINSALGEHLLSVSEAAKHVRVTPKTIHNWIRKGRLEAKKFGSAFRIRKQDIDRISDPKEGSSRTN